MANGFSVNSRPLWRSPFFISLVPCLRTRKIHSLFFSRFSSVIRSRLISSPLFSSAFSSSMQSIRRIRTRTHVRPELLFLVLTPFFVVAQHPMAHTNLSDSDTALCVCVWFWLLRGGTLMDPREREKGGSNGSVNRIFSLFNGNLMNYSDTRTAVALLYEWLISRRILFILFWILLLFVFVFFASSPNAI